MSRLSYDGQSCNHEESSDRKRKLFFDVSDSQTLSLSPSPPRQPASHPVPPVPAGWTASPVAPSCPCWALIAVSAWLPVLLVPTSTTTHTVAVSITRYHVTWCALWMPLWRSKWCLGSDSTTNKVQKMGSNTNRAAEVLGLRKPC